MTPEEIKSDFRRRYEGTYVMVEMPQSKQEELFLISVIIDGSDTTQLVLESPSYGKLIINYGSNHKIKFKFPKVGTFQCGNKAYIFTRSPQRQYQRGISTGNSTISQTVHRVRRGTRSVLTHETLLAAFVKQVYSLGEALTLLGKKKWHSVALNKNYSISKYILEEGPYLLFYLDYPIGTINKEGKIVETYEKNVGLEQVISKL